MISKVHIINKNKKIIDALKKLNKLKIKTLFIVDNENHLVGSLSEGDIRRALIEGKVVHDNIMPLSNKKPQSINYKELEIDNYDKTKIKKQLCYPVINEKNIILDIVYYEDLIENNKILDNYFFILAGGKGNRLQPLTKDIPKPMVKIAGQPILEILLDNIKKQNFINILISVNYKKEIIINHFKKEYKQPLKITYVKENKPLGTAGSIGLIKEKITKPFFIMNADLIYKINYREILKFFFKSESDFVIVCHYHHYQLPFGEVVCEKNKLLSIKEKPVKKYLVSSGIYLAFPKIQKLVKHNEYLDMPELITLLMKKKYNINVMINDNYWQDIANLNDLKEVNADLT